MHTQCQEFVDKFFDALELKDRTQCQALIEQLDDLIRLSDCYDWHAYLTGVFANEFERDWATGEKIFTTLLEKPLDPALRGRVLIALGVTYDHQGHWPKALTIYEQCLALFDQPDQTFDRAKAWKNMAIVLELGYSYGDFGLDALQQAIEYGQLVIEAVQALDEPDDGWLWLEATTWNTLALVYRNLGDWDQAKQCCQRCLALSQTMQDHYGVGMAHNNLGEIFHAEGQAYWPEAFDAYQQALEIYQTYNDVYEEIDVLDNLASLYQDQGDLALALSHYERAITLIEGLRQGISSELGRTGYFTTVTRTYESAILLCLELGDTNRAFNFMEHARGRTLADILADQATQPEAAPNVTATIITLSEVQNSLSPDDLLLEYFGTGLVEVDEEKDIPRYRLPPSTILLFAITADQAQVHQLELASNDLRPTQLDSVVERHFLEPDIRQALYEHLITPVESALNNKNRLYIIPHGPLHYIPFQALISPDHHTLLREAGPRLIYGASATSLFDRHRTQASQATQSILALGYNGQDTDQLHIAEEEAQRVARQLQGEAWTGQNPKKASFLQQAHHFRTLHISCHGEFNPENPLASTLHLAPHETLTAQEVLNDLQLESGLVVLSACESGLNQIRRGDELVGFTQTFIRAGTLALISTLWRVDERSTFILMEKFYQEVLAGVGFAEALKRAQLYLKEITGQEVRRKLESGNEGDVTKQIGREEDERIFSDPFYWAAFIFIGQDVN